MLDLGIVKPGSTVRFPFHTFDSNDPSASVTLSGNAVGDVQVYKNGGTTQRASTAGFTFTVDFDTNAGLHFIALDLSDDTTTDFYEAGAEYMVAVADVTIDAATVRGWVGRFKIGYEGAILDTTIATLSSQTSFTLDAGPADDDALNGCTAIIHDKASAIQVAIGFVSDYTGSSKTITLAADPGIFTMAAGDNISFMAPVQVSSWNGVPLTTTNPLPNAAADAAGGLPVSDAGGLDLDARLDAAVSSRSSHSAAGVWSVGTRTLTANTNLNDPTAAAIADQVWDEARSDHVAQGSFGEAYAPVTGGNVNDASATTTSFVTDLSEATNDHFNGLILAFTSGALLGQKTDITDYDGGTKTITCTALTEAPGNGDNFVIY